ncbi:sulfite exporter TauE/SafE family protein [Polycladidibacter stylochi]|uniref:sulfite exporter TauE/SafE family protein n=1 Tax=Polycladidibacter stylochi TaxID=1807766 RepID=UPI000830EDD2|nr:sulfite exporter TauE/SafE family protein [Pseudovibrio stylochi]
MAEISVNTDSIFVLCILFIAGLTRGFAGFGSGMIFIPAAATVMPPALVATLFLLLDSLITLPLIKTAYQSFEAKTVFYVFVGAIPTVFLGNYILSISNPVAVRWAVSLIVLALVMLLVSGWTYKKHPKPMASYAVGLTSGFLSGLCQMSGPPVVSFWLSGPNEPQTIRANLIIYFALTSCIAIVSFWLNNLFTAELIPLLTLGIPVYALSLYLGSKCFRFAPPKIYKGIALTIIMITGITSLPVVDGYLQYLRI